MAQPTKSGNPAPLVYISYSTRDVEWRDLIVKELGLYEQSGLIRLWDDRRIRPGDDWRETTRQAMEEASVALVLVSQHALGSPFITKEEIPYFLQRSKQGQLRLIPVLVSDAPWQDVEGLASIQVFRANGLPLSMVGEKTAKSAVDGLGRLVVEQAREIAAARTVVQTVGQLSSHGIISAPPESDIPAHPGPGPNDPPDSAGVEPAEVFISYFVTRGERSARVRAFAERLQGCGVNVARNPFLGQQDAADSAAGWRAWGEGRAMLSPRVIVIGSKEWFSAFEDRQIPGSSDGIASQVRTLRSRLTRGDLLPENIRVVLFDPTDGQHIPDTLRTYPPFHAERDFSAIVNWLGGSPPAGSQTPDQETATSSRAVGSPDEPAPVSGQFLEIFEAVVGELVRPGGPGFITIAGPRGSGKTTLAQRLTHDWRIRERFPGGTIYTNLAGARNKDWVRSGLMTVGLATAQTAARELLDPLRTVPVLWVLDEAAPSDSIELASLKAVSSVVVMGRFAGTYQPLATAAFALDDLDAERGAPVPDDPAARGEPTIDPSGDDAAYTDGTAGFSPDSQGLGGSAPVPDYLNVDGYAHRLADLIALRETRMPLALGLFGNWGSGKTHFMSLIDQQLKGRMAEEAAGPAKESSRWCREIVPIYFNAWHYLDADLWASLVGKIFADLFKHLGRIRPGEGDKVRQLQQLLEHAEGATARAAEETKLAARATAQAKEELSHAQLDVQEKQTFVAGLLAGLDRRPPGDKGEPLSREAEEDLGIEGRLEDLRELRRETDTLAARARGVGRLLWQREGWGWRLGFLAATLIPASGLAVSLAGMPSWAHPWLRSVGVRIAFALGSVALGVYWLQKVLGRAERQMREAEAARLRDADRPEVRTARAALTAARAKEDAARQRLDKAQTRERALREDVEFLRPDRQLGRFIERRAQSSDYNGRLGLVSLARQDFEEMSKLFASRDAPKERPRQGKEEKESEEERELRELSASIDRIVLFIDDLDRCQPEKVVDVLQAVHLLMAFPLFAVVVGVDQRCLRQSLRAQFKGLLASGEEPASAAETAAGTAGEGDAPLASPLDYLEKIFHVPFHLPGMDPKGFKALMDGLTKPADGEEGHALSGKTISAGTEPERKERGPVPDAVPPTPSLVPEPPADGPPLPRPQAGAPPDETGAPAVAPARSEGGPPVEQPSPVPAELVGSVPLRSWERAALKDYHPLIRTPRGATRLLNTYRLVRAAVKKEDWETFRGDGKTGGEFRVAMLLLAAAAGHPAAARQWFKRLRTVPPTALFLEDSDQNNGPGWKQFKRVYDATFTPTSPQSDTALFNKWLDAVERYTF